MTESFDLVFRVATDEDWPSIWPIFQEVVATGDTYVHPPGIPEPDARSSWMQPGTDRRCTYVAERDGEVVATAYVKPNQPGLGDHVCNAAWMVSPAVSGQGIGRRFAEWVIEQARSLRFVAMQFNAVVVTNTRAISLWESLGFEIVGTVPDAFRHAVHGPVAIHVMHRRL
ncbi:MAG TPA: GNAT family N-acetyltransferase [Acidimicrobiia bacterium]|jgi:L-amino acid N-acyltransferase YncA|nr:GNAT family N-acetyltransferase [Acidimicrobiia bacterium]